MLEVYRHSHPELFKDSFRMEPECFEQILAFVRPHITKLNTSMRKAIPAEQRLAVTLTFLSTGDSMRLLSMFFRMGMSTIREIVYETCEAIWIAMREDYMQTPTTTEQWEEIANEYVKCN